MKISKSALDKILSSLVPVNRAQILYKTMKQVAQGQYVVSDTRCPALSDSELE